MSRGKNNLLNQPEGQWFEEDSHSVVEPSGEAAEAAEAETFTYREVFWFQNVELSVIQKCLFSF